MVIFLRSGILYSQLLYRMDSSLNLLLGIHRDDLLSVKSGVVDLPCFLLDQHYVLPDVLRTRSGVRSLFLPNGHVSINLEDRLGAVGKGLQYQMHIRDRVGKTNIPEVGLKRSYSLLRHVDIAANPHFLVWFPGFGHTALYRSTKWEMALQAQIAKALGVNILCVNPVGRGIEGFSDARGIGGVSAKTMLRDTIHTTTALLLRILDEAGVSEEVQSDVIVSGHSLGAFLARGFAHELVMRNQRLILRGLIQEAPIGAGTGEDLFYKGHWQAIAKHLLESAHRGFVPFSRGMQFTIHDLKRLFYGEGCDDLNALLAAWALEVGESRNFLDISLFPGDLGQFIDTIDLGADQMTMGKRGVGSHIIFPDQDAIFHRGAKQNNGTPADRMLQETEEAGTQAVDLIGPHSYITPAAEMPLRIEVRNAYRRVFKLPQLELV